MRSLRQPISCQSHRCLLLLGRWAFRSWTQMSSTQASKICSYINMQCFLGLVSLSYKKTCMLTLKQFLLQFPLVILVFKRSLPDRLWMRQRPKSTVLVPWKNIFQCFSEVNTRLQSIKLSGYLPNWDKVSLLSCNGRVFGRFFFFMSLFKRQYTHKHYDPLWPCLPVRSHLSILSNFSSCIDKLEGASCPGKV